MGVAAPDRRPTCAAICSEDRSGRSKSWARNVEVFQTGAPTGAPIPHLVPDRSRFRRRSSTQAPTAAILPFAPLHHRALDTLRPMTASIDLLETLKAGLPRPA